ncbi:MAG: Ldh family oxidoreductase, partial [Candidatus Heimdallarchaeota archaeon]
MTEKRYHFKTKDIFDFAFKVLVESGYPEEAAKATVHVLLEADKRGIFSHGLAGGTGLEEAVSCVGLFSTVKPQAKPIVLKQDYPTLAVIEANASPGHISSFIAVDLVKKLARKYGLAKVFVKQANHFGAAGVYSEMIAKESDLVGTVTCTTSA